MTELELKIFARTRRDPSGPDGLGRVRASFLTFYTGSGRARTCAPALWGKWAVKFNAAGSVAQDRAEFIYSGFNDFPHQKHVA